MTRPDDGLYADLLRRGVSRRSFMKFAASMAAVLALPPTYAPRIAAAVATSPRLPVVWLRGQDCAGDTMAFLRASDPTVAELVLDLLAVEYHETLMAPAGEAATGALREATTSSRGAYIAIVEGSIPTAANGTYCMVGGRPFVDVVKEVCGGAMATITVGACAFDGGISGASGGQTGAVGAGSVVSGRVVNLPGCPVNVDNLTATIVHYLTTKEFPPTDGRGRPLFAYGGLVHNQCERRAHFEFGEFSTAWGDEGAQKGWCLYKMGCKGPETYANCPTVRFDEGTSWPVKAGSGCIGCTMPGFWDAMAPLYERLPAPVPFAPNVTADELGIALVGGVAVLTVAHGAASYVRGKRVEASERRAAPAGAGAGPAVAIEPGVESSALPAGEGTPGRSSATTVLERAGDASMAEPTPVQPGDDGSSAPPDAAAGPAAPSDAAAGPEIDDDAPAVQGATDAGTPVLSDVSGAAPDADGRTVLDTAAAPGDLAAAPGDLAPAPGDAGDGGVPPAEGSSPEDR
jgi:hydrogenase small subunit